MINTDYLEDLIAKSGKKKSYLADKIGCSRQYFRQKMNNEADMTTREVNILCNELGITRLTDKEKIFFFKM